MMALVGPLSFMTSQVSNDVTIYTEIGRLVLNDEYDVLRRL